MTLYTSDINIDKLTAKHLFWNYWTASMFCLLFGCVYELFSNEVYSYFMLGAFLFPLLLGALPLFFMGKAKKPKIPPLVLRYIYHSGVATLTVGAIVQGVLDIYGTTNRFVYYYFIIGTVLFGISVIASIAHSFFSCQKN